MSRFLKILKKHFLEYSLLYLMAERDFGSVRIGSETGDKRTIRPCPSSSLKMNSGKVLVTKTMWNILKNISFVFYVNWDYALAYDMALS